MTEPLRAQSFMTRVEHSIFMLRDMESYDSEPPEGVGIAYLPVARGAVYVASTIQDHETEAVVQVWPGVPPMRKEGELLGQVALSSVSGRVSVHALMGGPERKSVELDGAGLYGVRVYRFGGGPAAQARRAAVVERIGDGEDVEMPTDLESYVIEMWR
ncbi:hypothetical protein ACIRPT_40380 [Streptomyces sp. NPDC101227]|uniref:hypothetical protein n=1 Tax=Streptomyces sp. NPDC101227 TaxID=3366136 RepID=UPI0038110998